MSKDLSISVVIPNYNGRQLLENFLPHTYIALENAGVAYEVIVVDDCSKDDSVAFVKEQYPQIHLLINDVNKGFSYSCNRGINSATMNLIFLLNSDVKLYPNYFKPLLPHFDSESIFGVTGRIIDMDGDGIQEAGRVPAFKGFKIKTDYFYYSQDPQFKSPTFYLSGANALIDAQKIKTLGGFDEIFSPFYGEDLDLGIRAWRAGWTCYYEHQAICRHQGSASTNNYKTPKWVKSIYYRNRFFVHAIHLNGVALILWFLQITFIDLIPKLIAGNGWLLKSYVEFLKGLSRVAQSRKKVKKIQETNNSNITLNQVFSKIISVVKNSNITRFKA